MSKYGTLIWYTYDGSNRVYHREDGPAVEKADGTREWYLNDKLHREDGPAIEWANGERWWYLKGKCHREGGPAFEDSNGTREWYYKGIKLRVRTLKGLKRAIQLLQIQEVMES